MSRRAWTRAKKALYAAWAARAATLVANVGYVDGMITHSWHGKKAQRGYKDLWRILSGGRFDPSLDLMRDWQGVWQLTDRNPRLRDEIRSYFRARNEDSVDVE